MTALTIKTLLLDVGGVLLTNGWDRNSREEAARVFSLDEETNERHGLFFDQFEKGAFTLDEYVEWTVFYKSRPFSVNDFKQFMFNQSKPHPDMLKLMQELKQRYKLQIYAISNEGRELMEYRINTFNLKSFVDAFVCSGFVGMRKPDPHIYYLATDLAQVKPRDCLYVDDRQALIDFGRSLGFNGIHHTNYETTKNMLYKYLLMQD